MNQLQICTNKKDIEELLITLELSSNVDSKVRVLKGLRRDPHHSCYFCNGCSYYCEKYITTLIEDDLK